MRSLPTILAITSLVVAVANPCRAVSALGARHPDLSPDGSRIAFDWQGDIWVVSSEGGTAVRVTAHVGHDAYPRWAPDGAAIAFSSDRHGNNDIYVVGLEGEIPKRLTFHSSNDLIQGWSPDGSRIYFTSWRGGRSWWIHAIPREGGRPRRIVGDRGFNASISPDGAWIAYVRGYTNWWRKGYRGPANREIWVRALTGGTSYKITDWQGDDDRPQWSADGNAIFFQSEREDHVSNLYRQDLQIEGDRIVATGTPTQLTHLLEEGVRYLSLSHDGRWATFERLGRLYVVSTSGGEPRQVDIDCNADPKENEISRQIASSGATEFAFAPGEKDVAFVVEGEIYAAAVKDGELGDAIRLTDTDAREQHLTWLDAERLIYTSDRHGDDDIFLLRSTDPEEKRLGKSRYREEIRLTSTPETEHYPLVSPDGKKVLYRKGSDRLWVMQPDGEGQRLLLDMPNILHADWSPDSRFISYSITTLGHAEDIFIYEVGGNGTPVNVSNHPNDDFHPLWTGDGKRLSWASRTDDGFYSIKYLWLTHEEADKSDAEREREKEAEEDAASDAEGDTSEERTDVVVRIDWDRFSDRVRTVATVRGYYWDYASSPDGKNYALRTDVLEEMDLWTVEWTGEHLRRMTRGGADPSLMLWNEDGDKVRYISAGGLFEIENEEGAEATPLPFAAELTVDAHARRIQKFDEAWRLLNDGFYDEHFHGVDWVAMREKYRPLAEAAVMKEDFNDVLRQMIGELNASHLGAWGPAQDGGDQTGFLGFLPDDTYDGPGVRIAEILTRGPLDHEGRRVEPGEVIYAIDGYEIAPDENVFPLLNHKIDKEVDLTVGEVGHKATRKVTVEPIGGGAAWALGYEQWTDERRERVDQLSEGEIGYVHMEAMGDADWDKFIVDVFSRAYGKKGLILDVRGNNGGLIHDKVLTFLGRRSYIYEHGRGEPEGTFNSIYRWDGPVVMLTDEASYSDGEIFPWGFKYLGLGRIVGMPTFGAVIGTNDVELIDGTNFRIPGVGWFRPDGRNLENDPVQPDLFVPDVPEEELQGHDVQLEVGVEECLKMLRGE